MLYSVDYPPSSNEEGKELVHELSRSRLSTNEELDKIALVNAEALLDVQILR